MTTPRWMELAWAELGVAEIKGAQHSDTILGYFREVGRGDITNDETAWCAAWLGAMLARAGIVVDIPKDKILLAISYAKIGTAIDEPRVGAIAVTKRPGGHHVFFVAGVTPTHVVGLGGNQKDSVSTQYFHRDDILHLRWPPAPKDVPPVGETSRIAKAAKSQKWDTGKAAAAETASNAPPAAQRLPEFPDPDQIGTTLDSWQSILGKVASFTGFVSGKWAFVLSAVALYYAARVAWQALRIKGYRQEDADTGKTVA